MTSAALSRSTPRAESRGWPPQRRTAPTSIPRGCRTATASWFPRLLRKPVSNRRNSESFRTREENFACSPRTQTAICTRAWRPMAARLPPVRRSSNSSSAWPASSPDSVQPVPLSSRLSIWRWDWMPDGRLVIPQGPDLRIVSTAGSESVVASNMRHPPDQAASCGGGKYIVFRQFGGASGVATNLWRIDAAGTNLKQLTFGLNESDPECSRDGKWVYYVDRGDNRYLKRIYLEGGLAETVIYAPTGLYALSPDGKTIVKDEVRDSDHQLMLALYSIEEKKKSYIEYDRRALRGLAFF